ncbi:MAG: hypothetical protein IKW66_00240 [Clostridia bacterium]|nr:hypothetical protein [Clostridia bacterium]
MSQFFDLHSHMLCGVDDGAKTPDEMYAMLEMAYEDGTRALCLTPHYSPYLFGDTFEKSAKSFALLKAYVAKNHPDMKLFLGHELGYHHSCLDALDAGRCRTVSGSRYVLVDFPESVEFFEIQAAMDQLQRTGYFPILAHTERYRCLFKNFRWIEEFYERGGIIQINASSGLGSWGGHCKKQWKKLLKAGLVHVISTDGHNLTSRPPKMSVCMDYLKKHCSAGEIRALTWDNACRIVNDERI